MSALSSLPRLHQSICDDLGKRAYVMLEKLHEMVTNCKIYCMQNSDSHLKMDADLGSLDVVDFLNEAQYENISKALRQALSLSKQGGFEKLDWDTPFGKAWQVFIDFSDLLDRHVIQDDLNVNLKVTSHGKSINSNKISLLLRAFELCLDIRCDPESLEYLKDISDAKLDEPMIRCYEACLVATDFSAHMPEILARSTFSRQKLLEFSL